MDRVLDLTILVKQYLLRPWTSSRFLFPEHLCESQYHLTANLVWTAVKAPRIPIAEATARLANDSAAQQCGEWVSTYINELGILFCLPKLLLRQEHKDLGGHLDAP